MSKYSQNGILVGAFGKKEGVLSPSGAGWSPSAQGSCDCCGFSAAALPDPCLPHFPPFLLCKIIVGMLLQVARPSQCLLLQMLGPLHYSLAVADSALSKVPFCWTVGK